MLQRCLRLLIFSWMDPPGKTKNCWSTSGSGHFSPFEHASFTFAMKRAQRVASHQLVRHRIASFSQQSQRYVSMDSPDVIMPSSIAAVLYLPGNFQTLQTRHTALPRDGGSGYRSARFILPHGWVTAQRYDTLNAVNSHHFFTLRLCRRAQWEIRDLAGKMLREVRPATPLLFRRRTVHYLRGMQGDEPLRKAI